MDDSDFERLYTEEAAGLFSFLAYRTGDRALAEDLLADAFERALRGRFNPRRGSAKTWLYSIALNFGDFGAKTSFSGPARTIRCFQDNALVKQTLNQPGDGAVLVIDGAGSIATALMGDMIAEAGVRNGWNGVVINGAIRDREALAQMEFGIKALASNPRKSSKDGAGEIDVTVEIGGATVRPGAMVFADADGVAVEKQAAETQR